MTEKTVQVPVSLIEEAMRSLDLDAARPGLVDDLDALLAQPTPTAGRPEGVKFNVLDAAAGRPAWSDTVEPSTEDAWEKAAQIAERDAVGVTLRDLRQFPVVQATGSRIAFNIRAAAQKETP